MEALLVILSAVGVAQTGAVIYLVRLLTKVNDKREVEGKELNAALDQNRELRQQRQQLESQFQTTAREYASYVRRSKELVENLKDDIGRLEKDLSELNRPGAVRLRIQRLLSKTSELPEVTPPPVPADSNGDGGPGVPSDGTGSEGSGIPG